jgi:hypothetical protein
MLTILSVLLVPSLVLNVLFLIRNHNYNNQAEDTIDNEGCNETNLPVTVEDIKHVIYLVKHKRLTGLHPVNRDMPGECGNIYRRRGVANADETLVYTQDKENRIEFLIIDKENYMPELKEAGIDARILVETGKIEYTQEFWDNAGAYIKNEEQLS